MIDQKVLDFFHGDKLAAQVWTSKYNALDGTPERSINREVKELNRINQKLGTIPGFEDLYPWLKDYGYISTGGSVKAGLGVNLPVSISNCFVVSSPEDSITGIQKTEEEIEQICKRRGGCGVDLSTLRPDGAAVNNSAKSSTGVIPVADKYSAAIQFICQKGRRGALMISLDYLHPDVIEFVKAKLDLKRITGANISVRVNGEDLYQRADNDEDLILRFPIDLPIDENDPDIAAMDYGVLYQWGDKSEKQWIKKIHARDLENLIAQSACKSAEPGCLFWDTIIKESVPDVYPEKGFRTTSTNPCFTGDTIIAVADGRNGVSIKDLVEENKLFPVYSARKACGNSTLGYVTEVKTAKAFKTGSKEVILVTLSDGSTFRCTPDHRLFDQDFNQLEAKDSLGATLARFYTFFANTGYNKYRHINSKTFNKQYYFIADYYDLGKEYDNMSIHHKDGDSSNDQISNLEFVDADDHLSDDRKGNKNPIYKMNQELFKLLNKRKNILANASRWEWDSERLSKKLEQFDKEYGPRIKELRESKSEDEIIDYSYSVKVVNIEYLGVEDVYDLTVEDNHNFFIITKSSDEKYLNCGGVLVHNCGEIPLNPGDSCRLTSINWFKFVDNPYTDKACINSETIKNATIAGIITLDNIAELELEKVSKILEICEDGVEKKLWENIYNIGKTGRRLGLGPTGIADMLAALNIPYDSNKAIELCGEIQKIIAKVAYDTSHKLAKLRGNIEFIDIDKELNNSRFIMRLALVIQQDGVDAKELLRTRRNISMLTAAPNGTNAMMMQVSSGIEPVFKIVMNRAVVLNPGDNIPESRIVILDGVKKYIVRSFHPGFIKWYSITRNITEEEARETLENELTEKEVEEAVKESPYYNSTSYDIDPIKKAELQGTLQKWIDHSISVTHNLPKGTTFEDVKKLYRKAYKSGCKGVTVYVDGSRTGVLDVKVPEAKDKKDYKRPKILPCRIVRFTNNKEKWYGFVSERDGKPYEIFTAPKSAFKVDIPDSTISGRITKVKYRLQDDTPMVGTYILSIFDKEGNEVTIGDVSRVCEREYFNYGRLMSGLLRHDMPMEALLSTLEHLNFDNEGINSWKSGVMRAFKVYLQEGVTEKICPVCKSKLRRESGCLVCDHCGYSACS